MDDLIVQEFANLFTGRNDAWGTYGPEGKGQCIKEKVTIENYKAHLEGKKSLGVYPLLPDNTCKFFAIDLDEKNFEKAKAIRKELSSHYVYTYIAKSKSKGYHIYGFLSEPVPAVELRKVLSYALNKLNIKAELFPKQDKIDEKTQYGNYINLPSFGETRPFLANDETAVELPKAMKLFRKNGTTELFIALRMIPDVKPKVIEQKLPSSKKRKKGDPPCIEMMLKGISEGGRDEAAFALARHYLDVGYVADEIMGLLTIWDAKNNPPINDPVELETKIRSAEKGYAFGCKSITDNANLSHFCVGKENCRWFQKQDDERKKNGSLKESSVYITDDQIYEEIVVDGKAKFVKYDKNTKKTEMVDEIEIPNCSIIPIMGNDVTEGAVLLPDGVEDYGTTVDLVNAIKNHIHTYADIPPVFLEMSAWYIIMSWIYDKLSTLSYLRFTGDTGTGKSRCLDTVGRICYKPMLMSGAVTPAPIYRIIRRWRGTMVLDEADFSDTSEKAEVVTVLNCGFERGRPIIRCNKNDPNDLEILPCFCPKIMATRFRFSDAALESRCLTHTTEETDRDDIPALLGETYFERERVLRRKLLKWRLDHFHAVDPKAIDDIDLGKIEPRLKQTSLPFALAFKDLPDVMEHFKQMLKDRSADVMQERADSESGKIIMGIFKVALEQGRDSVYADAVSTYLIDKGMAITRDTVNRNLKALNIKRAKNRINGKQAWFVVWQQPLMKKLMRRYILDPEDYKSLFEEQKIDDEINF